MQSSSLAFSTFDDAPDLGGWLAVLVIGVMVVLTVAALFVAAFAARRR